MDLEPCAFAVWGTAVALHSALRDLASDTAAHVDTAWQDLQAMVLAAYGVFRFGPNASLDTLAFAADVLSTLLPLRLLCFPVSGFSKDSSSNL